MLNSSRVNQTWWCIHFFIFQERRMADQLDRDYELMSYNTHPAQLFIYELRNNYIRDTNQ